MGFQARGLHEGSILCGIFGGVGNWNLGVIRALAICNEDRGSDSLGFFDSTGKMVKCATTPTAGLRQQNISDWLENSKNNAWLVAGHTRAATRGSVNRKNAHPFRYGRIIGAHNGVVDCPNHYAVDSQYLFDTLSKAKGDYNKAWADISGYWGVSWYDGTDFYLQVHNGELHYGYYDGCLYYSSSEKHLATCIGPVEIKRLTEGQTLKCSEDGTVTFDEAFVSTAPELWVKRYENNRAASAGWWNQKATTPLKGARDWDTGYDEDHANLAMSGARDFDAEWVKAWAEYENGSEHGFREDNDYGH